METSIKSIKTQLKAIKLKRSFDKFIHSNPQTQITLQKSLCQTMISSGEIKQLKNYQDGHLFQNNIASLVFSTQTLKRPYLDRQKTQIENYQPLSRKRDVRRLSTLSYKTQKTQRSQKTQRAIEDLKNIGEISINNFEIEGKNSIRFNKETQNAQNIQLFKRWKTIERQKVRASKSPSKSKALQGKRAKNSPKKGSLGVRIRKTFIKFQTQSKTQNLSTIECCKNSPSQAIDMKPRKSSIAPWEIEQEFNY